MEDAAKKIIDRAGRNGSDKGWFAQWRKNAAHVTDFSDAKFLDVSLTGFNFMGLDLSRSQFKKTDLSKASFNSADKQTTKLVGAVFDSVTAVSTHFNNANLHLSTFKSTHKDENNSITLTDLTKATFQSADLRYSTFDNVTAEAANFQDVKAFDSVLTGDFSKAKFNAANLTDATLDGSDLRSADFSGAILDGASFRNVRVDSTTKFNEVASIKGCVIDRYTLACLGPGFGGLTLGNRMDMDIKDDVALLRSQFSGIWGWFHGIALIMFVTPYIWFLATQAAKARFNAPDAENSITLARALWWYIKTGGNNWSSAPVNWWLLILFFFVLLYNVVRVILLWKTKTLETKQHVSELPAHFSLAQPIGIPYSWLPLKQLLGVKFRYLRRLEMIKQLLCVKFRYWHWLERINTWGFFLMIISVAINSWHFLMMTVPLGE